MIRPLTSLRFFAAFAVFLSHLGFLATVDSTRTLWDRVFYEGYAGVTFFFVLSGFILTYTYADRIRTLSRSELFPYIAARVGRIVPTHLLTFVLSLPLMFMLVLGGSDGQAPHGPSGISAESMTPALAVFAAALNVLLLQAYVPLQEVYFSFNGPSWSLGNEMLFYALLPAGIVALHKWPKVVTGRRIFLVAVVCWLVSLLAATALRGTPIEHWFLYVNPLFRLGDFAIGACLGLYFLRRPSLKRASTTGSFARATILEVAAVGLVFVLVAFMTNVPQAYRFGSYYLPSMVLVIAVFARSAGALSQLLSIRPLVYLGEISFAFYMVHQLVIRYVLEATGPMPGSPVLTAALMGLGSIIASAAIYHSFETPMRLRIRAWAGQKWPRVDAAIGVNVQAESDLAPQPGRV